MFHNIQSVFFTKATRLPPLHKKGVRSCKRVKNKMTLQVKHCPSLWYWCQERLLDMCDPAFNISSKCPRLSGSKFLFRAISVDVQSEHRRHT